MDDFSIKMAVKQFSRAMVSVSCSINRFSDTMNKSFKKIEIDNLHCGNIDDIDIEKICESLMSCNTHHDIMSVLKSNPHPGTLLKVFVGLNIIEIDKNYTLKIKNKV